jgi:Glycolipid 2-alpha-mannosyltransferase
MSDTPRVTAVCSRLLTMILLIAVLVVFMIIGYRGQMIAQSTTPTLRRFGTIGQLDSNASATTSVVLQHLDYINVDKLRTRPSKVRNVILCLIRGFNLTALSRQLGNVDTFVLDNFESDFIVFHDEFPEDSEMKAIRGLTQRRVDFVDVSRLLRRPAVEDSRFDPYEMQPTWRSGGKWNYQQMCRFWFSDVFLLPMLDDVQYYMRIDEDSQFIGKPVEMFTKTADSKGE